MDVLKLAVCAIVAASLTLTVRTYRPDMALQVGLVSGVLMLLMIVGNLSGIFEAIRSLAQRHNVDQTYIGLLIKMLGIAYVAHFAVQACKDAGETAIAAKVELGGRVMIIASTLPLAALLLEQISSVLAA